MSKDKVLIVEGEETQRISMSEFLESKGFATVRAQSCEEGQRQSCTFLPDLAILACSLPDGSAADMMMRLRAVHSSIPVIILTGQGSGDLTVQAIQQGADQIVTKPVDLPALLVLVQRLVESQRNSRRHFAEQASHGNDRVYPFVGKSPAIRKLLDLANKVAASDDSLLIMGEPGTGKGLLARWLHDHSARAPEAFVDLQCGQFSSDRLESELLGFEKNVSANASETELGLMEIAHKGTLFLDEIGDVNLQIQAKLLTSLEKKQIRRTGEAHDRTADVRLIGGTQHDGARLMQGNTFQSDLYFRMSATPLRVPSLRERVEDIGALASHFLEQLGRDLNLGRPEISEGAISALQSYSWPGNSRELRNVLERALLVSGKRDLTEQDLHLGTSPSLVPHEGIPRTLEQVQRKYIEEVLFREGGRVDAAAKKLGMPRSSLYQKIKELNIPRPATGNHAQAASNNRLQNLEG